MIPRSFYYGALVLLVGFAAFLITHLMFEVFNEITRSLPMKGTGL